MNNYTKVICLYLIVINIITTYLTIKDKRAARLGKWRTSEACLLLLGLAGGAPAEFVTMKIIRHKTKHPKFMIGLPVEIIIQIAVLYLISRH